MQRTYPQVATRGGTTPHQSLSGESWEDFLHGPDEPERPLAVELHGLARGAKVLAIVRTVGRDMEQHRSIGPGHCLEREVYLRTVRAHTSISTLNAAYDCHVEDRSDRDGGSQDLL